MTRSSYQVTTSLDFAPFMNGFLTVQAYIKNFKKDIKDPDYFNKIQHKNMNVRSSPLLNEQDYDVFMKSQYCLTLPFVCMTRLKINRFILEVEYLDDIFDVTYRKFLNAIDHIEYHPSFQDNEEPIRKQRSTILAQMGRYKLYDHVLTPHEEEFIDKLLKALEEINSPLLGKITRMKQFSIINWFLGWGVYSNSRSIKKIKKNLRMLQDQNILQVKQIKELAKHLNLTMAHVNRHKTMLYELDSKLTILNRTLQNVMAELSYFWYENNLIDNMQMHINRIYTAIYALKEDIDSLYEYMTVLSTQQLNPLIMPPDILQEVFRPSQRRHKV